MDRNEFNLRVDQMRKQAGLGDYATAMKIADGIDWRRVPNVSLLSQVSEIYEKNQEYGEAKEILLLAFERAPMGKGLLYKLTQLALKDKNVEEADAYYKEFCDLARDDTRQYILQYQILKEKKAPASKLIQPLEQYNAREIDEEWLYELAEAYHTAGRSEDCIAACDRIMLLFGTGPYVEKAAKLKQEGEGATLTSYQQSLIDHSYIYEEQLEKVKEEYAQASKAEPEVDAGDILMEAEPEPEQALVPAAEDAGEEPAGEAAPEKELPPAEEAPQAEEKPESPVVKEDGKTMLRVDVPSFVASDVIAGYVDEGAKPPIQDEIDAQIEEHMRRLEEEKEASRRAAQELIDAKKAEEERIAAEKAEAERIAAEKAEAERIAAEKAEAERIAAEKAEAERIAREKAEAERIAREKAEAERIAREKEEKERVEQAMQAAIAAEKERIAAERLAAEQAEAKRIEEAAKAAAQAEKERIALERNEPAYIPQPKVVEELGITKVLPKIGKGKTEEETAAEAAPAKAHAVLSVPGDGNALIEGKTAEEALALAVERLKEIRNQTGIINPAAKIKAGKLNVKGLAKAMPKVAGKDLIIEEAGDLTEDSIRQLLDVLAEEDGLRTILLVDNPLQISSLKAIYPELAEAFHAPAAEDGIKVRPVKPVSAKPAEEKAEAVKPAEKPAAKPVEKPAVKPVEAPAAKPVKARNEKIAAAEEAKPAPVKVVEKPAPAPAAAPEKTSAAPAKPAEHAYSEEELDIDAFARYASDYAKKIDCVITGKSMLALYERIEIMQEDGVALTRQNAEALIEEAADRAEKPPLMKRIGGIFAKKYDKDGMLILKEDDFIL